MTLNYEMNDSTKRVREQIQKGPRCTLSSCSFVPTHRIHESIAHGLMYQHKDPINSPTDATLRVSPSLYLSLSLSLLRKTDVRSTWMLHMRKSLFVRYVTVTTRCGNEF